MSQREETGNELAYRPIDQDNFWLASPNEQIVLRIIADLSGVGCPVPRSMVALALELEFMSDLNFLDDVLSRLVRFGRVEVVANVAS